MQRPRGRALVAAALAGGWGMLAWVVWGGAYRPPLRQLFDGIETLFVAAFGSYGHHVYDSTFMRLFTVAMLAIYAIPAAAGLVFVARMLARAQLRATGADPLAKLRAAAERRPRALSAALTAPGAVVTGLSFALLPGSWKEGFTDVLLSSLPVLLSVAASSLFSRGLFGLLVSPLPAPADQEAGAEGYTFSAVAVTRETRAMVGALGLFSLGAAALLVALPAAAFETWTLQAGMAAYIAFAAASAYAFRRASRIALGLDGVLITGTSRRRFFAYRDLDGVAVSAAGDVELRRAGRLALRLQLHGEDAARRSAIVSRIEAGIARAAAPGAAHRFAEAATASHLAQAARGEVDYRKAGATREELWEVLEAPAARADDRTRAAAALAVGSDGQDRKRLRIAAEHCAEPATRAELMRIVEAEAEAAEAEASVTGAPVRTAQGR
jgi:hypothetical protein